MGTGISGGWEGVTRNCCTRPATRFAPSPTGYIHIGHVGHMLYVWGLAGILGGDVLLRIEDRDRHRCKREYEAALLEDMEWLGFEPANTVSAGASEYRQSDCQAIYADALRYLSSIGRVYRCVCTRRTLARFKRPLRRGEPTYPGLCRETGHPESVSHGLRLAWERGAPAEAFRDGLLGPQTQSPERQCGDLLLRDRLGQWSYQFAVTIDDIRHGVDFVVRGEDLLPSTGRQIRLARMLGRPEPPRYFHHPLVRDQAGAKLSKKQHAPSIRELRARGSTPAAVLGEAARAVGLVPEARPLLPRDASQLIERLHGGSLRAGCAMPSPPRGRASLQRRTPPARP